MAQILALLSLLKKLMLKELGSVSSVRFNNFLFCILLILSASGGTLKVKFWSTFFFQICPACASAGYLFSGYAASIASRAGGYVATDR